MSHFDLAQPAPRTAVLPAPAPASRVPAPRSAPEADPLSALMGSLFGGPTGASGWELTDSGEWCGSAFLADLEQEGWRVVHAPPVSLLGSGIDHVVVGPQGAFTVKTKTLPDSVVWVCGSSVLVDGRPQPLARKARQAAQRAARKVERQVGFSVPVTGVVAVIGADVVVREAPTGAAIASADVLADTFSCGVDGDGTVVLTPEQVGAVHAAAARRCTWA